MKTPVLRVRGSVAPLILLTVGIVITCQRAQATTFLWTAGSGTDTNWSDTLNWSPNGVPGGFDTVIFNATATTNSSTSVNNALTANTTVTTLKYTNIASGAWHVTYIPGGITLAATNVTIGGFTNAGATTAVAMTGAGTFAVYSNLTIGDVPTANTVSTNDLSGLSNFVFNSSLGTITIGPANFSLADVLLAGTNSITAATINDNINASSSSANSSTALVLGSDTNTINVGTFNVAAGRNTTTVSFPVGSTGGLRLRGVGGTDADLANMTLGYHNTAGSGSHSSGTLSFNGNPVDLRIGTIILGRSDHNPTGTSFGQGTISFDTGTIYASNIVMATTVGATASAGTIFAQGIGAITVGANGTLFVGSGGMSLVDQTNNGTSSTASTGTLTINGGTVISSNSIVKINTSGTGTISMTGGTLNMVAGSIGTPAAPVDTFSLGSATLDLAVANNFTNIVVTTYSPQDGASVANITALPTIFLYPTQFPLITYSSLGAAGSISVGTLPGTFTGYITNDGISTVWLVVTNGPSTAKVDQWAGVNGTTWDTTTLNWTNNGTLVAYSESDDLIFNDFASTGTVNFSTTHAPSTLTFTNDLLNYTLGGTGSISNAIGLHSGGTGSVTLSETGGDAIGGTINVDGGGTLVLDDANNSNTASVVISAGSTVQIGNNDANVGPPSGGLSDNGTLIFDKTDNLTITSPILGTGALNKLGSGVLTLAADNSSFTGSATVSAGTLVLTNAGSLSNSANVSIAAAALNVSGVSSGITALQNLTLNNSVLTLGTSNVQAPLTVSSLTMSGTSSTINVSALPPNASYPSAVTLVQSQSGIGGYNAVLGTLPAGFAGSLSNNTAINAIQVVLASGPIGQRPFVIWSGADSAASINWADAQDWQLPGAPLPADNVIFNDTDAQGSSAYNSPGGGAANLNPANINNNVNANFTVATLNYTNLAAMYQNTYITDGMTLTVTNSMAIGSSSTDFGSTASEFVTMAGTNGTLTVNNTNSTFFVGLVFAGAGSEQATLDMSGLGTFNASVSNFAVGAVASTAVGTIGSAYLAQTNNITAPGGVPNEGGQDEPLSFMVGQTGKNGSGTCNLYLGQQNTIYANSVGVSLAKEPAQMSFNPIFVNPTAAFYGAGGVGTPVSVWSIGDGLAQTGGSTHPIGTVDFTGGTVNALVTTMYIGRTPNASGGNACTGTLTFGAGTIAVTTVYDGYQAFNNTDSGVGNINVSGTGILQAGTLNMALATGGTGAGTTIGNLNITNGTVFANSIVAGTNVGSTIINSTINLVGGRLTVPTTIASTNAPLSALNLTPLNTPDNSNTVLTLPANANAAAVVSNLTIDGLASTTNILNISSVAPVTAPAELPIIQYSTLNNSGGTFNLGLGTLPAGYSGYFTNDATINAIAVVFTTVPVSAPSTNASITHVSLSGTNLIVQGTNNNVPNTNFHYAVLTSTNIATRLSNWTLVATNSFNPDGTFDYTNPIVPGTPRQFIDVKAVP